MKAMKRCIAWICQKIIGKVRWRNFLLKIGNISKNAYYNELTEFVMEKTLTSDSICIDVGCSKGDILKLMMRFAPKGRFFAFEPLPDHYHNLIKNFSREHVHIYNLALSDSKGRSSFNYVITNPGYSGIKKRPYDRPDEEDCQIEVQTDLLDNIVRSASVSSIDFIKIDVEGAECLVLKGAINCIQKHKPVIVFEHGIGAATVYGFTSDDLYTLLCHDGGLHISLLQDWLLGKPPLSQAAFKLQNGKNYYFMAHP